MAFLKYWNEPEKTAAVRDGGWHRTGDLGVHHADGYLSFHSRKDDVIITSGYRVGPDEIEESLAAHEAVAVAGVIGVPHEKRREVPKAFVVTAEGHEPDEVLREELQAHVGERLAKYEYPRELEFVEELPRTTTGKVRRQSLREREGL
jgi:acetyl-CoA synthetase